MQADRYHLHHVLIDMGFSARQTLMLITGWGLLCALGGLALEGVPAYFSLALYFGVFIAHCLFAFKANKSRDHIDSPAEHTDPAGQTG